jgi:riboflavin biosynthesis pyrimidine reductase
MINVVLCPAASSRILFNHANSISQELKMASLTPLRTLLASTQGRVVPLPPKLARLYGKFRIPPPRSTPLVFSNFVSTLDGVVSLQVKGHSAGGDISGFSAQDRFVMGLLRAVADVVIVGSGTLGADPRTVWTPAAICPDLAGDYQKLRSAMGKQAPALNVVVSAGGNIDLRSPVFSSGHLPSLLVTTPAGARRLRKQRLSNSVEILATGRSGAEIAPIAILEAVMRFSSGNRILIEGGPRLLGSFYQEHLIDEQFLTLAPQIAGRDTGDGRLGLVMDRIFAPRNPRWGALTDVRRGGSHLFLRYSFS